MAATLAALPFAAFAHGDEAGEAHEIAEHLWTAWSFEPFIYLLTALAGGFFVRGLWLRREPLHPIRAVSFLVGLALVFLALESPIDAMADHLYWMHQIQHIFLRMLGPMLMLIAAPQATIFAGTPRWFRQALVSNVAANGVMQRIGRFLVNPVVATFLFIFTLAFWQLPPLHNLCVLNDAVHYVMHMTMLASGIVFFWVIFDRRDAPKAVGHPTRAVMVTAALMAQIVIGSILTLKTVLLYPAYDIAGRFFGIDPMADEISGGFIVWAPSCMMLLPPLMIVVWLWNGVEVRRWMRGEARSNYAAALAQPETAEELWLAVSGKNARVGLSLALVPASILMAIFVMAEALRIGGAG